MSNELNYKSEKTDLVMEIESSGLLLGKKMQTTICIVHN